MILVVTGGRDVDPTHRELARLLAFCHARGVRILRHGCARGVDAAVRRWAYHLPVGYGRGERCFALQRWVADWRNEGGSMPGKPRKDKRGREYWPAAGNLRNGAMLFGRPELALRVEPVRWARQTDERADILVPWPGGRGTKDCVEQAGEHIEVLAIGDI